MNRVIFFALKIFVISFGVASRAQTYSPILIFNSSNVQTSTTKYIDHSPGTSLGFGMVVYLPAFEGFNYRGSVALQNRKYNLTYSDGIERHNILSTIDFGAGLSIEVIEMIGVFAGLEASILARSDCRGVGCDKAGGDTLAAQVQIGFSLGPSWLKFEPYYEHMPFRPISGTSSMTTYGLAIHFFPESFSSE